LCCLIVNHCLFFWSFSFDHCVVCHCKSLFVLLILFLNRIRSKEKWFTMTDNTKVKGIRSKEQTMIYNDRQYNGQQNKIKRTMIYNHRQHNGQRNQIKRTNNDLQWQTIQWSVIVNHCLFSWSYSFDHCVFCHCKSLFVLLILFFWPLCCLSL
jgi:hypothetical protein